MSEEQRLYLWVRIIASLVITFTVVVAVLAFVIIPAFDHEYHVDSAAIIGIVGTLLASALALVEVTVRLRRNNFFIPSSSTQEGKEDEGDDTH